MDYGQLANILKAMADPKRVKIIHLLSDERMCVCEILPHFDFTQPTLSHHLKVLEAAGIITVSKECQWHYYSLSPIFVEIFMSKMQQLLLASPQEKPLAVEAEIPQKEEI